MKNFLNYDVDQLKISQTSWDKNIIAKTESIMALGNGYLGLRSVDEEKESFNKEDLFVNGVFNKENIDEVPELANLANSIQSTIFINGNVFSLKKEDYYLKTLDLKSGLLTRVIKAKREYGTFEFKFERFVSQENKHLYCQKVSIKQVSKTLTNLEIVPMIDGQTTNSGAQHLKEGLKKRTSLTSVQYLEETSLSNRKVIHNLWTKAKSGTKILQGGTDDYLLIMNRRQIGFKIKTDLSPNKPFILEKIMTINTSIDKESSDLSWKKVKEKANELFEIAQDTSFEKEFEKSKVAWKSIYKQFFVEIKGASQEAKYDQMANIFGIFHVNGFVPKNNSNLSIGAKGLSGEGYQGHCFWDTEFFVMPNYLFTKPEIAKNLLVYRYKGIKGAREKALEKKLRQEESNLKGAQYPWEMAWPTEGEVCPYWGQADVVTGKQEPIASRRQEIHVSAAIAFAVDQYFNVTQDNSFMNEMGYEMIFDTAIFWAYRAEKQKNGTFEIKDVMGPNEYKGNIDNNAYINAMAKYNLELAFKYFNKLKSNKKGEIILEKIINKLPYKIPWKLMENVKNNLVQQKLNNDLVIAENDQFLQLKRNNVSNFQLLGDAGKKLFNTKEGHKLLSGQLVKQADVVLLNYLLPQLFNKKTKEANFNFYEPITTHDSSLSPTTYAIMAIDLRKMDKAYELFKYAINIDLGLNMHSSNAGIHAGSLAAIWQTTIFGYGGFRWINGNIHLNPVLPSKWEKLKYTVSYQGALITVEVFKTFFKVNSSKKTAIFVNGNKHIINDQVLKLEVKND